MPGKFLQKQKARNPYKTALWVTIAATLVIFLIAFRSEIAQIPAGLINLIKFTILRVRPAPEDTSVSALFSILFNCCCSFVPAFLLIALTVASQALLPTNSFLEKYRTAWHLILHFFNLHGPAIFVKDGKAEYEEKDKKRRGPGVIVVDFNSAVVLEEQIGGGFFTKIFEKIMVLLNLYEPFNSPRAHGPGIIFTRIRERIRGVVDLRKQNRGRPGVKGYTRDGIELTTNVWTIFSVAQEPPVVEVTYDGRMAPENIRVLNTRRLPDKTIQVNSLDDELDAVDRQEIHDMAQTVLRFKRLYPYTELIYPPPIPNFSEFEREDSPLQQRIFSAVFTQARDDKEELIPWEDLPPHIAVDVFREVLSHYNYDQLFRKEEEGGFPVAALKKRYRMLVRNTGLLSYRLVFQKYRQPITPGIYDPANFAVSEVILLQNLKVLRERGISIIACGFSDLKAPDSVYEQRLDNWLAKWEQEISIARSNHELEALRVQSKARAQAQQELRYDLLKILQNTQYPDEVVAMRVLQALESAAADPKTRQFLPTDTIRMIETLRMIMSPQPPENPERRF